MARMIPNIDPDSIENAGEQAAYPKIQKQLPDKWMVRHHYPFCWRVGKYHKEGEADFIVIAPGRGLMFIEVKGSHGFDCRDGQWYRCKKDGSHEPADNPFEQASNAKHQIVGRITRKLFGGKGKEDFPGVYGHLVMYPKGKVEGALPESVEPTLMVAYRDMNNLRQRIEGAFDAWGSSSLQAQFTPENAQHVASFFCDNMRAVPVLSASVEDDDHRIEEITRLQFLAFRGLLGAKRVHVTGPAGSGKTLLARWTSEHLSSGGERVLLTCYNRVLAEWLRQEHRGDAFEIHSFFSLCRQVVQKAGLPFKPSDDASFWTDEAPRLFVEALDRLSPEELDRFDGVIVDEGQDFHEDWWLPLLLLLRDPDKGRLCVFSDDDQRGMFGRGGAYPSGLVPFELRENCRNTKKIATYCGNVIGRIFEETPLQPEGTAPSFADPHEDPKERSAAVKAIIGDLIGHGFRPSQIAILSPFKSSSSGSSLAYLRPMHGFAVGGGSEHVLEWKEDRIIWASTIKAFKGLEAACVILTDASITDIDAQDLSELYVGATRAKHKLITIPKSEGDRDLLSRFLESSSR